MQRGHIAVKRINVMHYPSIGNIYEGKRITVRLSHILHFRGVIDNLFLG